MRATLEVMRFEIRYQLRSPFFLGALLMFALIHFLAITGLLGDIALSNQVATNSAYSVLHIELLLFIFGMLPILAFVTTAITRDFENATAALIYVTPIRPANFALGKFLGALSLSLVIGLSGLLGSMIGTFMPWLDQARIIPFSLLPWAYNFLAVILPGIIILCAIFFSVAALTRSFALTYGAAVTFFAADVLLNVYAMIKPGTWSALADPSARLTLLAETRYWTIPELNSNIPLGLLPLNRLLWLTVALLVLLFVLLRFRLDLAERTLFRFKNRKHRAAARVTSQPVTQPAVKKFTTVPSFSPHAALLQFVSQLKRDLSCVFKGPLIYIILALEIMTLIGEFGGNKAPFWLDYPLYPLTSLMLPFLGMMLQFILLVGIWCSSELIHRERVSGVAEIVNTSPYPDWLMILSKTAAMCLVVHTLMLVAVLTLMALQAAAGYTNFEPGLYLQSAFIYNGIYFCMLCIVAVVIQAISPNKWLGMLLTLGIYIVSLSLPAMGFDHMLYNLRITAVYSDMNGFGHFIVPAFSLIGYWGAFCILLLAAGHLLYPRGNYSSLRERNRGTPGFVVRRGGVCRHRQAAGRGYTVIDREASSARRKSGVDGSHVEDAGNSGTGPVS
jgi:ABC-2 type transport system permease protein